MNNNITGVILAGGENSRMGTDKGLLTIDGKNIMERIIDAMKPSVQEIIIITNGNNYDYFGYKIYNDLIKKCGPMGGIFTALSFSKTEKNFVVSCDMPFVNKKLVQFIIENASDCEITIPSHNERLEPLCAVYDKSCTSKLEELLKKHELKLLDMLKHFKMRQISIPEDILKDNCFANINTPAEYEKVKWSKHEHSN